MEIINTQKGGQKLCHEGFMYHVKSKSLSSINWSCTKRAGGCKGAVRTTIEYTNLVLVANHNYHASLADVAVTKARDRMKTAAKETNDRPANIYANVVHELDDLTKTFLPAEEIVKRTIRNSKSKKIPAQPENLVDLQIDPDGPWAKTGGDDPQRFLVNDNGPETESRIIIFATDDHLRYLINSRLWMMDGFSQIFVIHAPLVGSMSIPLVYALLQRKNQHAYEEVLKCIFEKCAELDAEPDPEIIITDYEQSIIQALRTVLGDEVETQGCFYHLTQATWRKVQELGLSHRYKTDAEFRLFCGKLDGLAFLPVDDVMDGMNHIRDTAPVDTDALLSYFDSVYVNGTFRERRRAPGADQQSLVIRRIPPRYPPHTWNVHQRTLDGDPRTNNLCEGWNNRYRNLIGHNHPNVWRTIRAFQMEQSVTNAKILQNRIGTQPIYRTKQVYRQQQERLKNLCLRYNSQDLSLSDFLTGVGHNIHFG